MGKTLRNIQQKAVERDRICKIQICNANFFRIRDPRPQGKPSSESNPSSKKSALIGQDGYGLGIVEHKTAMTIRILYLD